MKVRLDYLQKLRKRGVESRVYKKYQLIGLEIARVLEDKSHNSLYIKLAKNGNAQELLRLAKDVAERRGIKNKGAYFMVLIKKH